MKTFMNTVPREQWPAALRRADQDVQHAGGRKV